MASQSRLLALPPELRRMIYDFVFADMIARHELDEGRYYTAAEYPTNGYAEFTSLALTCKIIGSEATPCFETHFLSQVKLYFHSTASLYAYHKLITTLGAACQNLHFTIVFHGIKTNG